MRTEQSIVEDARQEHGAQSSQEGLRLQVRFPGPQRSALFVKYAQETKRQLAQFRLRRGAVRPAELPSRL